jgi:hypothetical protein
MAHNFKKGIDWATDPTGATPLPGYIFVSKSGDDANPGTPDLPKKTINGALAEAASFNYVIIGTGVYKDEETGSATSGCKLIGDGVVLVKGSPGKKFASLRIHVESLIFEGYDYVYSHDTAAHVPTNSYIENCVLLGSKILANNGTIGAHYVKGCILVGTEMIYQSGASVINGIIDSVCYKCDITINSNIHNSSIVGCNINITTRAYENIKWHSYNNYFDTPITIDEITYSDLSDQIQALPAINTFSTGADPKFSDPEKYSFVVNTNSPLFGAGYDGTNIGRVKIGRVFTQTTDEIYNSEDNNFFEFDGLSQFKVSEGQTEGYLVTTPIDFGKLTYVGAIPLVGVPDFVSSVPTIAPNMMNPNALVFYMRWAGLNEDITTKNYYKFRFNEIPAFKRDLNGNIISTNGDDQFYQIDEAEENIVAKVVQLKIFITNNYVQS